MVVFSSSLIKHWQEVTHPETVIKKCEYNYDLEDDPEAELCRVGRYANNLWEQVVSYPYPYHAPVNPTNLVAG